MSSNNSGGGVSLCGVIFLILFFLKLFGVISISWWWVFAPLIIGFVIGIFFLIILILAMKK